VHLDGHKQELEALTGQSVMKAATSNLVAGIIGECGGELSCATCHVFVEPEWLDALPEMSSTERDMLEVAAEEPTDQSRLCCQIVVTEGLEGLTLRIPRTQT
jgi:2Fe-2S ferredoxin